MLGMSSPTPVTLHFDAASRDQPIRAELSAVVQVGGDLWLGADEGAGLERLSPLEPGRFGAHTSFPLADLVTLPGGKDEEIDIEGLDFDDGCLWLVGSHAVRRRSPDVEEGDTTKKRIRRLARLSRRGNQHLLARIPLDPASWAPRSHPPGKSPPERPPERPAG